MRPRPILETALRALDVFLPPGCRDGVDRQRGRILVALAFGLGTMAALGAVLRQNVARFHPAALALLVLCVGVFLLTPWLFRATGAWRTASLLLVLAFGALIVGAGALAGGVDAPVMVALPLVPILTSILLGARAGLGATLAALGAAALLALAPGWGLELPPAPFVGRQTTVARALVLAVAIGVSGFLAAAIERRLRRSEELYRRLFEQSKDAVTLSTPDGRLLDVNQAGVELYGFGSREEMLAWDVREAYDDPAEREALLARLAAAGYVKSYATSHRTRAGELRVLEGTTSTLRGERGEVELLLAILRDVTDRRRAETEREELLGRLREKNADLEAFTYAASHDLKGPLISMRGLLRILAEDAAAQDVGRLQQGIDLLGRTVEKMRALIDGLLELALLGREGVAATELEMGDVAREAVETLAAGAADAAVEVEIAPDLPRARGDRTLLRTIFQNLVDNAVRFSAGSPGARVRIGARREGAATVFLVADNGPGIPPEHRETVFSLGKKLDPERSRTGIGLTSVRRAVELQGGRVWVESEGAGRGSTFCFTLPVREPA